MGREEKLNPNANVLLRDGMGRALEEGDVVILTGTQQQMFRILQMGTMLEMPNQPNMPKHAVKIQLLAMPVFVSSRGAADPTFIRVATAEEAGPMPLRMQEAPEAEGESRE